MRAQNSFGSDEQSVTVKVLGQVTLPKPPKVKITAPLSGNSSTSNSTILKASATNVTSKEQVKVEINNVKFNDFAFANGEIQATLPLVEGNNTIKVTATNNDGSDDESVSISYTKPKAAPTVKITSPANNTNSRVEKVAITAKVENAVKQDISCFVNGKIFPISTFWGAM